MKIEVYDQTSITWKAALAFAAAQADAFRDDAMIHEYFRPEFRFSSDYIPSITDYTALMVKAHKYRKYVNFRARKFYLTVLENWNARMILANDDCDPNSRTTQGEIEPIGGALWFIPAYGTMHYGGWGNASWWHRLSTWVLRQWLEFRTWLDFLDEPANPFNLAALNAELHAGEVACQGDATEERLAQLKALTREERKGTSYPRSYSYTCSMFFITGSEQKRGTGREFMEKCTDYFLSLTAIRGPLDLDPKFTLFTSPAGLNFYPRVGFAIGAQHNRSMPSGQILKHTYFYRNFGQT